MLHWIVAAWHVIAAPERWQTPQSWWSGASIPALLFQHLAYTVLAVGLAVLIAVPLGLAVGHTGRGGALVVGAVNTLRSIPTLGVLLLALLFVGVGYTPPILALTLLAAAPVLAGTYAGILNVDPAVVDAAHAIGMPRRDVLVRVQLPLALPLVLDGVRGATMQVVATATVAAYAGLGGLGTILIEGVQLRRYDQVLAGAALVTALTLLLDAMLSLAVRASAARKR
ncbi:binding-protein-dependent transport systems inner membrane component [Segniliparus rotundus DSM 44985]|uniref:Binding-protein-dependent transport systems inner membrane component n=1 Tax=Segniliparus rotundus (strain ATCC BAA-972 / CDC 1076 / CIP 108378 / DSM 44985 / JCM 13578) TaxID=640132 RepID=D6ZC80_SEGRD|nr:ABC transporter permease subunit [Segniliparus rotundus]ADG99049.1 binding-protein-dependent transport systems inner membrane component [Segniliparus rotundus DSM 44985]